MTIVSGSTPLALPGGLSAAAPGKASSSLYVAGPVIPKKNIKPPKAKRTNETAFHAGAKHAFQ